MNIGTENGTVASDRSSPYVWYVIALLATVNVFNYMDRMALAVLMPVIKQDLLLTDGQLGLLVGFAFFLFYAVCGVPLARWADRGIRRDIIALSLATWSVMTALSGAAQNFWHLLAARMGLGAGEAGGIPAAQSILCDYVPLERRSGVFALHSFGLIVGLMLGMALAGWLGETLGWRWTFVALGVPGIVLALLVRLTLREPRRESFDTVKDEAVGLSFGATLRALWGCKTYRLLTAVLVGYGFVQFGLNQWWPSFYARSFGLSMTSVGVSLGIAIGAGAGVGLLIGGLMADKAARRDVRLPLKVGAVASGLALPAALASLFVSSAEVSIVLVSLTALLWSVPNGPILASLCSIVAPQMRATASSLSVLFTSVLGFGLGPFCVGVLSDTLTPTLGKDALRYALLAPACVLPLIVVAMFAAARKLPGDLRAAGALK